MATVSIYVHSDHGHDFDEQISAIQYAADALEAHVGYIFGDPDKCEQAREALIYAVANLGAAVMKLYDNQGAVAKHKEIPQ